VPVSQILPVSTNAISPTYLTTPAKKSYQAVKTTQVPVPKAYSVELSHSAQARSLRLQGFSVLMISIKLGLDVGTVNQYLGISGAAIATTTPPTYVQPKAAYSEPKAVSEGRSQLAQDINQLTVAGFTWSNTMDKLLATVNTTKQEISNVLLQ
jgi:hypothetical protein